MPINSLPDADLRALAVDISDGRVFHDRMCRDVNELRMIFMPIGMGGIPSGCKPEDVGLAYEYLDKAGPRSINGKPMFFSVRFLNQADTEAVAGHVKAIDEAKEKVLQGGEKIEP